MTLTPQDIHEQKFHQQLRGYDQSEVDDFLERVADRVAELMQAVDEAQAPAEPGADTSEMAAVVPAAAPAPDPAVHEQAELIQRTLLTAQKTADDLVAQAEARASDLSGDAETRSSQMVEDARQQAAELLTESEREANELLEAARRESSTTRETAASEREQVQRAIAELQAFRHQYGERVRAVISEHLELFERASDLPEVPAEVAAQGAQRPPTTVGSGPSASPP